MDRDVNQFWPAPLTIRATLATIFQAGYQSHTMSGIASGLVLGFLLATSYGTGFHLLLGGPARRIILYVLAAWVGFAVGHHYWRSAPDQSAQVGRAPSAQRQPRVPGLPWLPVGGWPAMKDERLGHLVLYAW
jgi:hypothetical protein